MRYRKKPVVIEAVQLLDSAFDGPHPNPEHIPGVKYSPKARCALIDTLEGTMRVNIGDWIIQGIKGELYPCKPDIFEATYELAEDPSDFRAEVLARYGAAET